MPYCSVRVCARACVRACVCLCVLVSGLNSSRSANFEILKNKKQNKRLLAAFLTKLLCRVWTGYWPQQETDYSNVEKFRVENSSGHHCMSGIYNIEHYVMTWQFSTVSRGHILVL